MRRDDGGDGADGDGGGLLEHAVDAVAHAHLFLAGLEVDVGGAALDGLLDHPVHELDDADASSPPAPKLIGAFSRRS